MGDLLSPGTLRDKITALLEWKRPYCWVHTSREPVSVDRDLMEWLERWEIRCLPFICDTGKYLYEESAKGRRDILFEAQLGALRDIDLVSIPTHRRRTTSPPMRQSAPVCAALRPDRVLGIMKPTLRNVGGGVLPGCSVRSGTRSARQAASMVRLPDVRAESAHLTCLPRNTV